MELSEKALKYQEALAKNPNSPELNYNLGVVLHKLGELSQAKESYEKAIALQPNYTQAYFNLAVIYQSQGDVARAISLYHQAMDCDPEDTEIYHNLGALLIQEKEFEQALHNYQKALEIDPLWADTYYRIGYLYFRQNEFESAIPYLRHAIKLDPKIALAHYHLGVVWLKQCNWTAAVTAFQEVICLEPENILAYSHCANALIRLGKFPEAFAELKKAIALQPRFVEAWIRRVSLLAAEKDILDRAKVNYAKFLQGLLRGEDFAQLCPYLYHTYLYRGDVWYEYGSYRSAELCYYLALEIKLDNPDIYLRLGNCLIKQQRYETAILTYHFGLNLQPDHPQLLYQLAHLLAKQGNLEQSIKYYEKLLQIPCLPVTMSPHCPVTPSPLLKGIYSTTKAWMNSVKLSSYQEVEWGNPAQPISQSSYPLIAPKKTILHQCGGVNCVKCMDKLIQGFQPKKLEKNAHVCALNPPFIAETPTTFVATIPDGKALIAPQKNDWLICNTIAIITPDNYLLGDLSRFYPWRLPGCDRQDLRSHPLFSLEEMPPLETIEGTVAVLSGLAGHVYYHWLIDLIPRIGILSRSGIDLSKIDWFVVNSLQKSFQKETLQALGISLDKVIESDRHPYLQAKQLVMPSFPGELDWPNQGTINFLRQTFLTPEIYTHKNYPDRIYISRAKSQHRHLINELEVIDCISRCGFVPIFLEEMSFREQIALFAAAKAIIAPHGSGLTNILFSQPETQIIEFFAPRYRRSDYLIISQQLQLKHYYLIGENFDCYPIRELMYESAITDNILINLDDLQSLLKFAGIS